MKHEELDFKQADGTLLRATWRAAEPPNDAPRGTVLVIHGFAEHRGRYAHFAERAGDAGWNCMTFDLRGHGESAGARGHIIRFDDYLADATLALDAILDRAPRQPICLLGHSMGGLIASHFARRHQEHLRGLVLSSPAIGFARQPGALLRWFVRRLNRWAPGFAVPTGIKIDRLSRNPAAVAQAKSDPKRFGRMSMRCFSECTAAQERILAAGHELQLPILMLVAGDDALVRPEAARALFEKLGSVDREFFRYDDHYHELLQEIDRDDVIARILSWLEVRSTGPGPRPSLGAD